MENQVEEVKKRTDIVGLINEFVSLKKAGRNYKAVCPFHAEKTPSFMVSPDRQIFKCFGCGEGGDVFAFLKRMEGMEFAEALKFLADRTGVRLKEYQPTGFERQKDTFLAMHSLAADIYHHLLTKHAAGNRARDYLSSRRISPKSVNDFYLGFAPESRSLLAEIFKKKGFSAKDAVGAGLLLPAAGRLNDRFVGRLMFPVFNAQGKIVGFSGRSLGKLEPKYLNSPETPIFNKSKVLYGINLAKGVIQKEKRAILVEGNLDVISSHQTGVKNVVAPLGTAVTENQVELLKRWAEELLIAFDTDLAGDAAAHRGIEIAENSGLAVMVVVFSAGKDPDEVIRKDPLLWKKAVKEAVPIYDYYIESAVRRYGVSSAEAKRKVATAVLPQLARLSDEIIKSHYLQTLGARIGIEEPILRGTLQKYSSKTAVSVEEVLEKPLTGEAGVLVEKYLLSLIIQSGQNLERVNEKIFTNLAYRGIFKLVKEIFAKEGRLKIKSLTKAIPEALLPTFDELLLFEISPTLTDQPQQALKEINYCATRLKELNLRRRLRTISLAIKQAEVVEDVAKVKLLSEQFRDLSRMLSSLTEG